MTPALFPATFFAALGRKLAARLEAAVRRSVRFLSSFDANARCIFGKFELSAFA
jgi:hypothetical protein